MFILITKQNFRSISSISSFPSAQIASKLLYGLNGLRQKFGAGPLIWSSTLDIGAKAANDAMQKAGVVKTDPNIKHGTLQCIKLTSSDKVVQECLSFWWRQMQDYDWSKPAIKENNKFFVTAVNKAATHAGVSVKKGPSGRFFCTLLLDPAPDKTRLKDNVKSYTGKNLFNAFQCFQQVYSSSVTSLQMFLKEIL